MILLITTSPRAGECAVAIERATGKSAHTTSNFRRALRLLRQQEFDAIVVDQCLPDAESDSGELLPSLSGAAILIFMNLALSGTERVVRDVRAALNRREQEQRLAMLAAERILSSEIRNALTGILLSSELALNEPTLPAGVAAHLRSVQELAEQVRSRLEQPR
jgi:CheY-like chemotaxis protein